jgi:hypothetical protein
MTTALDLFAEFAVDEKAAQEGVWHDYGDVKFLVAQAGNRHFRQRFLKLYKPHERLLKTDSVAAETKSNEIMADTMAHTILLNWQGKLIVEKGGQPVEYSIENATKALMLPAFREMVEEWSKDFASYQAVKEGDVEKN